MKHDLAILKGRPGWSLFDSLLNEWRLLCEKTPKGFEKYYPDSKSAAASSSRLEAREVKGGSKESNEAKETPPPPPTSTPSKSASESEPSKPPSDWNFGLFGPNPAAGSKGNTGGQGRPISGEGGGDQTKMIIFGALGTAAVIAALSFFEMGYKEISWKDFVNK